MAIQVQCPKCSKEYRLKDELAGKKIRCKECETSFVVPAPKKKPQSEEPQGSISTFDLAALDLAEEERKSRAYKKREVEEEQKVKKKEAYIDHEHADVMLGNIGKFAGMLLAVHFIAFVLIAFLSWMKWDDYIKFFYFIWRLTFGLLALTSVGCLIGSLIWFSVIAYKEHVKFFAANLVTTLLSWLPLGALTAVGVRYLLRQFTAEEGFKDVFLDEMQAYLLGLGIATGIGIVFPIFYLSTRWERVSRSIYLALIGIGVIVACVGTWSLIDFMAMLDSEA